jgi:phage tail-like protein
MTRTDPYRNFRFLLETDGLIQAGFSEITVPDISIDVVEYREGDAKEPRLRKMPGLHKFGKITLKAGVTADSIKFYEWIKSVMQGKMGDARLKSISIIVKDEEGNDAAKWEFEQAWPSKYDAPDLNAKGNDVAIELLEIVHEGMTRAS